MLMEVVRKASIPLMMLALLSTCRTVEEGVAGGILEISFKLNPSANQDIEPSYQTVIWLEDKRGRYVKSLLVSEYLSYGGYTKPEICPDWSRAAQWGRITEKELDAVTSATPQVEANVVAFDCREENLRAGVYRYCVQTHIVEQDNILFTGMIEIGGKDNENIAEADPAPRRHVQAGVVLSGVKAFYHGQRSGK
jgi:hypothetical protein